MEIGVAISHFLIVLSCSANFIIYCRQDSKFRSIIAKFSIKLIVFKRMNLVTLSQSSVPLLDVGVKKNPRLAKAGQNISDSTETQTSNL